MKKLVVNHGVGGFVISCKLFQVMLDMGYNEKYAIERVEKTKKENGDEYCEFDDSHIYVDRENCFLVKAVEFCNEQNIVFNNEKSTLVVVEIPEDCNYFIEEFNGVEWVDTF